MAAKTQLRVENRLITVTNLDKILYPAGKFTKQEVISYYAHAAPYLLPHLRDRPVTLKRFPDGVLGQAFYEKNAPSFTPDWVQKFPVPRRERSREAICYILINDLPTLVWTANLASLELHPFLHRAPAIHQPTAVAFDLDPGEGANVLDCVQVGFWLKEILDGLRLQSFPKVSGSKGLQIYVPLNTETGYPATQHFARSLARLLSRQHPERVVDAMAKELRRGKVFVDWSQNSDHKTTVSVYSLRAKQERPFVSMPVTWEELRRAVRKGEPDSLYFEAGEALARLKRKGDLFEPVLKLKQRLPDGLGMAFETGEVDQAPTKRATRGYSHKRESAAAREPSRRTATPGSPPSRRRSAVQWHSAKPRSARRKHAGSGKKA